MFSFNYIDTYSNKKQTNLERINNSYLKFGNLIKVFFTFLHKMNITDIPKRDHIRTYLKDFSFDTILGRRNYGAVYQVTNIDNKQLALKEYYRQSFEDISAMYQ
jgi:hypothetical protein